MKGLQDSEALGNPRGSLRSSVTSEAISMICGVCHHKAQMLFEDSKASSWAHRPHLVDVWAV